MDFSLTEEQAALRMMGRDLFAKLYPTGRLRELWEGGERDPQTWRVIAEQGLTGLAVSEEHGGFGGDAIDVMVVLEEAGRACLPEPYLDTVAVALPLLTGTPLADQWLPTIVASDAIVSIKPADQPFAVDADIADLLLIEDAGSVLAVEAGSFTATHLPAEDRTRRLFSVTASGGQRIGPATAARAPGALAAAAVLNGIAGALLDQTLGYVKVRQQFGVPVGSFQAVKHKLASVFATLESSRAATRYAAYAAARGLPDAATAASVAKVHAVEAESLANTEALQCHAGIGFTWEHDLHFWLKRGRAMEHAYGSAREHRAALAASLFDN